MPKFAILPSVRPPAKQKEATTAAVSTSSLVIRRLCSRDGAAIIQRLPHSISQKLSDKELGEIYLPSWPFVTPKKNKIIKKAKSELRRGGSDIAGWMLHAKNNGTKSRRRPDRASNLRPDHIWREENLHSQRPTQSPRLKSRK
jgi:hypothetical protein